ncbi:aspartyl-trna synthetase [Rhodobacteraceae bacterium RKSG542]|uniref:SH3 domain-containing protein n=1 Tax=Pseudovibrio flavus TaxID=2529854 RepID=UPI0012BC3DE5|nr:SH3 domain-containing protein [Pseudovibrio flavus]MTI18484.1 aspartyl-trna synthetase [Pseudovibrio flavus]
MANFTFRSGRFLLGSLAIAGMLSAIDMAALAQTASSSVSGLPIPRYVSLKSDRVNVRVGPSREHDVSWTFIRSRLPVEIIAEYEDWRRIRDWEGQTGWVFRTLLTGYRSALVTPWESAEGNTPLRRRPGPNERVVAELEPEVLVGVLECKDGYCRVSGRDFDGWVDQSRLFGVYPDEVVE